MVTQTTCSYKVPPDESRSDPQGERVYVNPSRGGVPAPVAVATLDCPAAFWEETAGWGSARFVRPGSLRTASEKCFSGEKNNTPQFIEEISSGAAVRHQSEKRL